MLRPPLPIRVNRLRRYHAFERQPIGAYVRSALHEQKVALPLVAAIDSYNDVRKGNFPLPIVVLRVEARDEKLDTLSLDLEYLYHH